MEKHTEAGMTAAPATDDELRQIDAYWRAANYLGAAQIYLREIIFAFHGYPSLIHRLAYRRTGHANMHVRGYKEQGTTTTPFDMLVRNDADRFKLVCDVIDRVPGLGSRASVVRQLMTDARARHRDWIVRHGEDMPEIRDWRWQS